MLIATDLKLTKKWKRRSYPKVLCSVRQRNLNLPNACNMRDTPEKFSGSLRMLCSGRITVSACWSFLWVFVSGPQGDFWCRHAGLSTVCPPTVGPRWTDIQQPTCVPGAVLRHQYVPGGSSLKTCLVGQVQELVPFGYLLGDLLMLFLN